MKKRKQNSIQSSIFRTTSIIILFTIAASTILYYSTMSYNFVKNYLFSSNQLTKIISSRLDTTVRDIDQLQRKILESDQVREYIFHDLPNRFGYEIFLKERDFVQEIYGLSGYDYPFYHLSIVSEEGYRVSFGEKYDFSWKPLSKKEYKMMNAIYEKKGAMLLKPLYSNKIEPYNASISLCRAFSLYPLNLPKAVMEIQLEYKVLENAIEQTLASYDTLQNRIIVLDSNDCIIFPRYVKEEIVSHYRALQSGKKIKNPVTEIEELVTAYTSAYTGWTTYVITPYQAIAANTREYLLGAIGVGSLALFILLLVSYFIAREISSPIIAVKDSLSKLSLENLGVMAPSISSNYNELELLQEAFSLMEKRLQQSINDYVEMRSLSVQSQVMALQSQINPHFLYNTLSIITILAEENQDFQVAKMGHQLVHMLRYSSRESLHASIAQEIEHAKNYAELMEVRFENKMEFSFQVDPDLLGVKTPSIIIQPLIENCVKYAGKGENRKLFILIEGVKSGEYWEIRVSDNGQGFPTEVLEQFHNAMQNTESFLQNYAKKGNGIGLANIFRRLYLFYNGDILFNIENRDCGATVTVGGCLTGGMEVPTNEEI